ncbi:hypothetical protein [Streptomyces sp. NPDC059994]|uniref:hypothetical protein n=1 Tax=Streptomyces sp. NPDC059994 TaxID=3347029 RepID=UPI003689A6D5
MRRGSIWRAQRRHQGIPAGMHAGSRNGSGRAKRNHHELLENQLRFRLGGARHVAGAAVRCDGNTD